jgi:putative solute:sodium symporter small subunit
MNSAYKKECWLALIAFAIVTLLTHVFPFYFAFPGLTQVNLFGFPAHYLLTMVVGWLVLMPLYWIYINMSEKIDDEIRNSSAGIQDPAALDSYSSKTSSSTRAGGR